MVNACPRREPRWRWRPLDNPERTKSVVFELEASVWAVEGLRDAHERHRRMQHLFLVTPDLRSEAIPSALKRHSTCFGPTQRSSRATGIAPETPRKIEHPLVLCRWQSSCLFAATSPKGGATMQLTALRLLVLAALVGLYMLSPLAGVAALAGCFSYVVVPAVRPLMGKLI